MITWGSSRSVKPPKANRSRLKDEGEDAIVFIKRDAEGVLAPHNDTVVVMANITNFNIHHVFIDNGRSVDILYFSIFTQIGFIPN